MQTHRRGLASLAGKLRNETHCVKAGCGRAGGGTRTRTGLRPEACETSASADSATPAPNGCGPWQDPKASTQRPASATEPHGQPSGIDRRRNNRIVADGGETTQAMTKTERWLNLLAFLLGRCYPVTREEILSGVRQKRKPRIVRPPAFTVQRNWLRRLRASGGAGGGIRTRKGLPRGASPGLTKGETPTPRVRWVTAGCVSP